MAHSTVTGDTVIHTLDLNFRGIPGAIASYLIPHAQGAILVESGPGSTLDALISGLNSHGLTPKDITDVFLTHIHLDHAGAAGRLASYGARIHVHPIGAPHLLDPDKLLSSAKRIYGDQMDALWGEFLPVPGDRLSVVQDGETVEIGSLRFTALDTPGHADHHFAYLFEGVCFSGDVGGVRLRGQRHLRLPMPPPEFHLEKWRASISRLGEQVIHRIAPTHFGIYADPHWHLGAAMKGLDEIEAWIKAVLPGNPDVEALNKQFLEWTLIRSQAEGVEMGDINAYETANPSWMSSYGIQRYWNKYHAR